MHEQNKVKKLRKIEEINNGFTTLPQVLVEFTPKRIVTSVQEPYDELPIRKSSLWKDFDWVYKNHKDLLLGNFTKF